MTRRVEEPIEFEMPKIKLLVGQLLLDMPGKLRGLSSFGTFGNEAGQRSRTWCCGSVHVHNISEVDI